MKSLNPIIQRTTALMAVMLMFQSAHAATEHWIAVPGTSSDTNWTTGANWSSPQQTFFNQVQFLNIGSSAPYTVNTVLNGATGPAQMPIWQMDFIGTNANYTLLIQPGVSLSTGAGNGKFNVGAGANGSSAAPANAVETIAITGANGSVVLNPASGSYLNVGQGSASADTHNIIFDMSGLGTFQMVPNTGSRFLVANSGPARVQGTCYLAMTNIISLGNDFQVGYEGNTSSNSMPCAVYLGITNYVLTGSGNNNVVIGYIGCTNGILKFNPTFLGGPTPPVAYFGSSVAGGRGNFTICNNNTGSDAGYAICDFTGGNVTMMEGNLNIGQSGGATNSAMGVLTFDNGVVNVNTATVGNQNVGGGGQAIGIVNLNTNSTYNTNATMVVNNTLTLGLYPPTGTPNAGTEGIININGGALVANMIANDSQGIININGGSLTVTGTAGLPLLPITSISATNSTMAFALNASVTNVEVKTLTTAGTNTINILSAPPLSKTPTVFRLVQYSGSIAGAGYNFVLGTLPPLCSGYLSNDTANSSIDLVLTSGPLGLTWDGAVSGDWDTTTTNWLAAGPAFYADGDYATFADGANTGTVNLTAAFAPGSVTVSNNSLAYTFTGSGNIGGSGSLVKQGTSTLVIDNNGPNSYTGGTTISGGTLQIGNADGGGNIPGNITDNASFVFDRNDDDNLTNSISGSGTVTLAGGGTVTMSGSSTFTNTLLVTNNSTLQLGSATATGNATAAGAVVISSGSTLDINGNSVAKKILVAGSGNGNGAITDNGGSVYDNPGTGVATNITLLGDTTLNFPVRWDLGSPGGGSVISTGGQPYNLTLSGNGYFEWRNLALDPALANITLESGTLGIVGSTSLGSPSGTLTLTPSSAGITFYNATVSANVNKQIDFQGGTIANGGGNNSMSGTMTLEPGYCTFNVGGSSTLTLSNVISGSGVLYQNGGTGTLVVAGNSPSFSGGVDQYEGTLVLNGTIGSGITDLGSSAVVTGNGTANGLVDIYGTLLPGGSGVAGTFTTGGLTMEGGSTLTMDLTSSNTVGGGVNDLVVINGDLNANNNILYINPIGSTLTGTYTLMTYTGTANSFFSGASTVGASRYVFILTNNTATTPSQVNLIVSGGGGGPASLVWNNASGSGFWDTQGSQNWSNQVTQAPSDYFFTQDSVTFDDSINNSPFPTTNISIPGTVIPNRVTNNSSASYTFSGPGKISGGASIVKLGTGTLTIDTTNDFTGAITVGGGTLVQGTNSAFGSSTANLFITNSGTVDLNGYSLNARPITVSGAGVGGNGAIINNGVNPVYDNPGGLTSITLAGDATFGAGPSRWDLGSSSGGTLSTGGKPYNLSLAGVAGSTYWEWDDVTIDPQLANINILGGQLGVKGMTSLGNPAGTVSIYGGGQLTFWGGSGYAKNYDVKTNGVLQVRQSGPVFNLNVTLEGGSTLESLDLAKTITGPVSLTGLAQISVQSGALTLSGVLSGPGGFYMDNSDANPLVLTNVNSYTGPTLLTNSGSGCTLVLSNNGSISGSSLIGLAPSTTLDVSGRTDKTLTLASGQTLGGSGLVKGSVTANGGSTVSPGISGVGTLTVTNAVNLQGTTAMYVGAGYNNLLNATNISFAGSLNLTFTPGSLAAGNSFKLFNAGTYSGQFASVTPAPGSGLAWDQSQLAVNGTLRVVQSTPPRISSVTVSGTSLHLSGTGGAPSGPYKINTSTNLQTSLTNWTTYASGSFDTNGNFNFTGTINLAEPSRFFILVEP